MDKNQAMSMLNCSVDSNLGIDTVGDYPLHFGTGDYSFSGDGTYTCWDYYQREYYPYIVKESYPVYLQERAKDKGKQAFEIIKILKDKKLVQLKTVGNFIDLMDELIKIL